MKKFFLAAAMAALFSVNSFAAFVQCTPSQGTLVDSGTSQGNVNFTCSPSATAGNIDGDLAFITGIQIAINISAQVSGGVGGGTYGTSTTMSNSGGFTNVSPNPILLSFVASGLGGGSSSTGDLFTVVSAVGGLPDSVPTFTVTLNSVANGLMPANSTATVYYQATTQSAVPEPSTMALFGSALIGLGLVARRRK